jgi:serine/threonine protein kinase
MEYLPGETVEQLVKRRGPLPPERAVYLLRQLCGALREAHAAGLIHRDIKPSNVIVCERGGMHDVAKLLDFGIVDWPDPDPSEAITAQGQLLGTPAFMSPEQAAGESELDGRSDLASLGATAYFMLTGKPPFDQPTINLTIAAQLRDPVTPPHGVKAGVPQDLSEVVVRCLEKDPARRYQSVAELDLGLAACACAVGWSEERAVDAAQPQPDSLETALLSTGELERRWGI